MQIWLGMSIFSSSHVVYQSKLEKVCEQNWNGFRRLGHEAGRGVWLWDGGVAEEVDVAVGTEAADDGGTGQSEMGD